MSLPLLIGSVAGYLLWCALMIVPLWRIYGRAGLSSWLSLLFAVPFAGPILVLGFLALLDWPSTPGR